MRDHVDFVQADDVAPELISDGPLAGSTRRLLSEDSETGDWTALVALPPGFASDLSGAAGSLEFLVLDGDLEVRGDRLGPLGWARTGTAVDMGAIASAGGAAILWMTGPCSDQPVRTLDAEVLPWAAGSHGGPAGIAAKVLADKDPVSLLMANVPRYDSGPEFHECPEELFVLEGDVTGKAGTMTRGSYFWRPEYITHGPYRSEAGLLCFLRGHGDLHAHWIENEHATVDQNRAYAAMLRRGAETRPERG